MIEEKDFNKVYIGIIVAILFFLSFLILKPLILSIIFALLLSLLFYPLYSWLQAKIKRENISAFLICLLLVIIIILPFLLLTPYFIKQTLGVYTYIQEHDLLSPIKDFIDSVSPSEEIAKNVFSSVIQFKNKIALSIFNSFTNFLLSTPTILLHVSVILFVFFFGLRDGEKIVSFLRRISPFSKEAESKIFKQFKDITKSVLFGQILVGVIQGILVVIALIILGIPNALFLGILTMFFGILPLIGPSPIWFPITIYLFMRGDPTSAIILLVYGLLIINSVDNIVRPLIVGKSAKINSGIVLVSMIGGLFVFGMLGLILGPLIISYLILVLENYRRKEINN